MAKIAETGTLCGLCSQRIEPGDQIVRSIRDGVVHIDCDAYGVGQAW